LADSLELAEQALILEALRLGNGNRQQAATKLGISPRTLRYKLARLREMGVSVPAA
jgi:two-component system response regulator FlrC